MLVGEALNDEIAHRLVDVVKGADGLCDVAGGRLPERDAARRHVVERFVDELFLAAERPQHRLNGGLQRVWRPPPA